MLIETSKGNLIDLDINSLHQPFVHEGIYFSRDIEMYEDRVSMFKKLPNLNNKHLLDLGCNMGINSFIIKNIFPTVKITGWDIIPEAIQVAKDLNNYYGYSLEFFTADNAKISVDQFDHIDYLLVSYFCNSYEEYEAFNNVLLEKGFKGTVILLYPDRNATDGIEFKLNREQEIEKTIINYTCDRIDDLILIKYP